MVRVRQSSLPVRASCAVMAHFSMWNISQPRRPQEALIKIRKAGICSTDLELVNGYYPYTGILGHEFVGEVVEADVEAKEIRVQGKLNGATKARDRIEIGKTGSVEGEVTTSRIAVEDGAVFRGSVNIATPEGK